MNNNRRPSDNNGNRPKQAPRYQRDPRTPSGQANQRPGGGGNPQGNGNTPNRPGSQNAGGMNRQSPPNRAGGVNPSASRAGTPLDRIGGQNPGQRRSTERKIKLTAEQIEINRVNRQREKYYIKKRRSAAIRTFISRVMLFLVVFAVLCGITASLFFMNLTKTESVNDSGYSYKIGDAREYKLAYSDAVREGRVYVNFSAIAELCDLAVTGSQEDMKYIIKKDETETIRFLPGTRVAYVNSVETRLGSDSFYKGDELYVPLDFVSAYFKGLTVSLDESKHSVTVGREVVSGLDENGKAIKGEEIVYSELYFLTQLPSVLEHINEEDAKQVITMPDLGFTTNLDTYEQYMNPGNTTEYLTLVNVSHTLASDSSPQDLVTVVDTRKDGRAAQQMRLYAEKALEALFIEMRAAGYDDVSVTSGYRAYSYQETLFNDKVKQYSYLGDGAYAAAAKVVNPPGSSEHQSGLCADLHNLPGADVSFGQTDAFKWISENCWKFGFILRYEEDKTEVTGISYEPWHYRYVGRYHAQQMKELDMCLEEYWVYLGNN